MTFEQLNTCAFKVAEKALLECCGSSIWAQTVTEKRPYSDMQALKTTAELTWNGLAKKDWLEAFAAHPKIGESKAAARWSAGEQAGMVKAADETAIAIAKLNAEYVRKFGWIFIVCATGRSAEEMLDLLKTRIHNEPAVELSIAAAEQLQITRLRLDKLVAG